MAGPTEPTEPRRMDLRSETGEKTMPGQRSTSTTADVDVEELERLRAEVDTLRGQITTQEHRAHRMLTVRRIVAAVLVVIAAFGTAASTVGLWAARTTLDTDRWVSTVEPLPANTDVANAVSIYVTDELFRVLDVRDRVAEALPPQAAFVAVPVTNGVRDYIQGTVQDVIQSEQFSELWVNLNRVAHERIMAIIEGESTTVTVEDERVTLNLLPVVNNVLAILEDRAPTLFGRTLNLPAITNGEIPPGLETRIETALGRDLPDNFSQITIYRANELNAVQDAVASFKKYIAALVVGTLLALALALWVSPWRRRTILQYGVWLAIAVLVVARSLRAVRDQILGDVPAGAFRQGTEAAMTIIFTLLRERADQLIWLGVAIALVAYLVGPGRAPRWLRRTVVTGSRTVWSWGRDLTTGSQSSTWVQERLDGLRIGGVVVAGVIALLLSSWGSLLTVLVLLGVYEVAVTLIARPRAEVEPSIVPTGREQPTEEEAVSLPEEKPVVGSGAGGTGQRPVG